MDVVSVCIVSDSLKDSLPAETNHYLCLFVPGSMRRLSSLIGLRTIRSGEEDPHHVFAERAVRTRSGEASHRASDRCGERRRKQTNKNRITKAYYLSKYTVYVLVLRAWKCW